MHTFISATWNIFCNLEHCCLNLFWMFLSLQALALASFHHCFVCTANFVVQHNSLFSQRDLKYVLACFYRNTGAYSVAFQMHKPFVIQFSQHFAHLRAWFEFSALCFEVTVPFSMSNYSLSYKTVNTSLRENFLNVYCFMTNQKPDETAKDNWQTTACIQHRFPVICH